MVRIVNYQKRTTEDGKVFFVLEIQSGITLVKSKESGKFYATANKATLSSTFDEDTCKALIGTEIEGNIVKVACEPYQYVVKETGELIELQHRFEFVENNAQSIPNVQKSNTRVDEFLSSIDSENVFVPAEVVVPAN
ncbi:hypothetical protein [Flavobacterium oreochromis]|uniref:Uncharacterized protein n=1 Tax=Flavobacterium oreochromis TaxID=2906078 RepID=A0ABW8P873_9FLAO|nr:hypothetical protein [Flavobacterium oreochromis]OWP78535.1 hypothetical protein BWG23_01870 [Flavobacterium oreochromis]